MVIKRILFAVVFTTLAGAALAQSSWKAQLHKLMPLMGHRNWICIVDSAYPLQSGAGIETIWTGEDQAPTVKAVLAELKRWKHVQPLVYLDKELQFVDEHDAPGINAYRNQLAQILKGAKPTRMPHEDIIKELDEAGKTFHVVIIKTKLTVPYTSVFLRLDCGYWGAAKEAALRKKMAGH